MLVLTRRESDKVLFPSLGISVEVLRVQGNKARLGINAPDDVPILRHEVADLKGIEFAPGGPKNSDRLRKLVYAVRSRLDAAAVGLNELHRSIDEKSADEARRLIEELFNELSGLEREAHRVIEDAPVSSSETPQVLLVESSAAERKLLEAYLDLTGFQVITAKDGQDALDYLSLHAAPDIVLLEMSMARVDGVSFVRAVRSHANTRPLPIFALSDREPNELGQPVNELGQPANELGQPVAELGLDGWYTKPIDPRSLVAEMNECLRNRTQMVA